MRTLLRKIPAGTYFQAPNRWTRNPVEALDFKAMRNAVQFVEDGGYRNVEVAFISEHPRRLSAVRVDTLEGLEE